MSIRFKAWLLAVPATLAASLLACAFVILVWWAWQGVGPDGDLLRSDARCAWLARVAQILALVVVAGRSLQLSRLLGGMALRRGAAEPCVSDPRLLGRLRRRVDELRWRTGAPPVDRIELVGGCAAAIHGRRRWLIGPRRSVLRLGLPMLQLLTPNEASAVIVHELVHLRNGDTRGGTIVRYTGGLLLLLSSLADRTQGGDQGWWRRRADRFMLQCRREGRRGERLADQGSASHAGRQAAAVALVRIALADSRCSRRLRALVRDRLLSISRSDLQAVFASGGVRDSRDEAWLRSELSRTTAPDASHPCLPDRLRAIGVDPRHATVPAPVAERESAAAHWLGEARHEIARALLSDVPGAEAREAADAPPQSPRPEALEQLFTRVRSDAAAMTDVELQACHHLALRHGCADEARAPVEELLRRPRLETTVQVWLADRLIGSDRASDAEPAERIVFGLVDTDAPRRLELLAAWAEDRAMRGELTYAHAAWRLATSMRLAAQHTSVPRERWIAPDDIGSHALDASALALVEAAAVRAPRVEAAWLVRLHGACTALPPRHALVVQPRLRARWRRRERAWRRDRAALATALAGVAEVLDMRELDSSAQERLRATWGTRVV